MRVGAAVVCAMALAGCARRVHVEPLPPEAIRAGLTRADYELRLTLAGGAYDSAVALVAPGARHSPKDDLLAQLYRASADYYAGRYGPSGRALEEAALLADDRFTKSISRNLMALATSDNALPYEPSQTERLMMNYYGMLDYLRRDDTEGAAVEARRLSKLLEGFDTRKDSVDVRTRALLNYLAGATFEAAGDRSDAEVSYRVARALVGDSALPLPVRRPAAGRPSRGAPRPSDAAPGGELLLVVEHGYVAHRVPRRVLVPVTKEEMKKFGGKPGEKFEATLSVSARTIAFMSLQRDQLLWRDDDDHHTWTVRDTVEVAYFMPIAWASFQRPSRTRWRAALVVDSGRVVPVPVAADLSDAVANDFRRARSGMLARSIARAAVKLALAKTAEAAVADDDDDDDDDDGHSGIKATLARWGVGAIGAALERADLRQWRLLPGEIAILRIPLSAGTHDVALDYVSSPGAAPRRLRLGPTTIVSGKLTFATTRVWEDGVIEHLRQQHRIARPIVR